MEEEKSKIRLRGVIDYLIECGVVSLILGDEFDISTQKIAYEDKIALVLKHFKENIGDSTRRFYLPYIQISFYKALREIYKFERDYLYMMQPNSMHFQGGWQKKILLYLTLFRETHTFYYLYKSAFKREYLDDIAETYGGRKSKRAREISKESHPEYPFYVFRTTFCSIFTYGKAYDEFLQYMANLLGFTDKNYDRDLAQKPNIFEFGNKERRKTIYDEARKSLEDPNIKNEDKLLLILDVFEGEIFRASQRVREIPIDKTIDIYQSILSEYAIRTVEDEYIKNGDDAEYINKVLNAIDKGMFDKSLFFNYHMDTLNMDESDRDSNKIPRSFVAVANILKIDVETNGNFKPFYTSNLLSLIYAKRMFNNRQFAPFAAKRFYATSLLKDFLIYFFGDFDRNSRCSNIFDKYKNILSYTIESNMMENNLEAFTNKAKQQYIKATTDRIVARIDANTPKAAKEIVEAVELLYNTQGLKPESQANAIYNLLIEVALRSFTLNGNSDPIYYMNNPELVDPDIEESMLEDYLARHVQLGKIKLTNEELKNRKVYEPDEGLDKYYAEQNDRIVKAIAKMIKEMVFQVSEFNKKAVAPQPKAAQQSHITVDVGASEE